MRYIVTYTKPGQIEGARIFDIDDPEPGVLDRVAREVAGPGATVVSVVPNDGSPIGEFTTTGEFVG